MNKKIITYFCCFLFASQNVVKAFSILAGQKISRIVAGEKVEPTPAE